VIFPLGFYLASGPSDPVSPELVGHFLISFWIAGLIAATYSFFAVQFIALRILYPRLWVDARGMGETAASELASIEPRLRTFQLLAALIPLAGATLLIGLGPEDLSRNVRLLVAALIVSGMAGIGPAVLLAGMLTRTLRVLAGAEHRPS
jgi:hypothetical protein